MGRAHRFQDVKPRFLLLLPLPMVLPPFSLALRNHCKCLVFPNQKRAGGRKTSLFNNAEKIIYRRASSACWEPYGRKVCQCLLEG